MKFKRQELQAPSINLVPMLDVAFILLLFFVVSSNFRHGSRLALTLPSAQGLAQEQQQNPVTVGISADGRYSVNGNVLSRSDASTLKTVMTRLGHNEKSTPLIISADANSTHQAVVTVMDVAGQLGFVNVSISTVKPQSDKR